MEITNDMNSIAREIAELYKRNIQDGNLIASGNLSKFVWYTQMNSHYFELVFDLPTYWKYAAENSRTSHKMPPIDAIEEWVKIKRLPVPTTKSGIPQYRSVAYLIARKIGRVGWRQQPRKTLQNAIDDAEKVGLVDKLCNLIADEIYNEDLKQEIDNL